MFKTIIQRRLLIAVTGLAATFAAQVARRACTKDQR